MLGDLLLLILVLDRCTSSNGNGECDESSARLVGGATDREGRVEVCYEGQWRTVCNDWFDNKFRNSFGRVICRQLGYTDSIAEVSFATKHFGIGSGNSLQIDCSINGKDFFECLIYSDNCNGNSKDVGLRCLNRTDFDCDEGSVRLVNGSTENEGRVEVCFNGQWGTVSLCGFGVFDGQVVCRQLGYPNSTVEVFNEVTAGTGGYQAWFDLINCAGNEENILECSDDIYSSCSLDFSDDVRIRCSNSTGECSQGSVRLVNGTEENEGRLEVCYNGQWRTVCDNTFDYIDAHVVCKQLGYSSNGSDSVFTNAHFGRGNEEIWLETVKCHGNENNIFHCEGRVMSEQCGHSQDIGIRCTNVQGECSTGSLRLVDGQSKREGRLEVCFLNHWNTACGLFSDANARVTCRQLGYTLDDGELVLVDNFTEKDIMKVWFDSYCYGNELSLLDCYHFLGVDTFEECKANDYVGIKCFDVITFEDSELFPVSIVLGPSNIQTSINMSCGIANSSGTVEWIWEFKENQLSTGYGSHYQIITSDSTLTSTLVINNLRSSDSGLYYCSANYPGRSKRVKKSILLRLGAKLTTASEQIWFTPGLEFVSFGCELHGYFSFDGIKWKRNGQEIRSIPGVYEITTSTGSKNNSIQTDGRISWSIISHLSIINPNEEDIGSYVCYTGDEMLNISLMAFESPSPSNSVNIPQPAMDINLSSLIGGVFGILFLLIVIIIVLTSLVFVRIYSAHKKKRVLIHQMQVSNVYFADNSIEIQNNHWERARSRGSLKIGQLTEKDSSALLTSLITASNLKLLEKIGQGEFGIVYRGVLQQYWRVDTAVCPVAVKTLRGNFSESQVDQIVEEAHKMQSFDHLNVLPLIGICLDDNQVPSLVMPFMSNGSLLSYLRKEAPNLTVSKLANENVVSDVTKQLLSMCLQVAKGMAYLAEQKFVHRDLAARNCLLSSDGIIKVSDFGLTEDVYTTEYFKQRKDSDELIKLPLKWMALESIHYGKFSEKTDIWSYGVLCWEVFTSGKSPYPGMGPREVVHMLDAGERLDKPLNMACTHKSYSLMLSCWNQEPDDRPFFSDVISMVEEMMAPLADYMDFNSFHSKETQNAIED